jgi:hypothetical protein
MRNCGNDPAFGDRLSARFEQPTNMDRLGRLIVLRFPIELPITDEPWLFLPFASSQSSSGVQIHVDTVMQFPDGSTTDQGTFIVQPP